MDKLKIEGRNFWKLSPAVPSRLMLAVGWAGNAHACHHQSCRTCAKRTFLTWGQRGFRVIITGRLLTAYPSIFRILANMSVRMNPPDSFWSSCAFHVILSLDRRHKKKIIR